MPRKNVEREDKVWSSFSEDLFIPARLENWIQWTRNRRSSQVHTLELDSLD